MGRQYKGKSDQAHNLSQSDFCPEDPEWKPPDERPSKCDFWGSYKSLVTLNLGIKNLS
jgi:hypothetical protein